MGHPKLYGPPADWEDIALGVGTGAVTGGVMGIFDPGLGIGVLALYGGLMGAAADATGQVVVQFSKGFDCHPINWGTLVGSTIGGAAGGAATPFLAASVADGVGAAWTREFIPAVGSSEIGTLGTLIGGIVGSPKKPCDCK